MFRKNLASKRVYRYMNKKIENITEELIMKYVEEDMSSEEFDKFERILSQNEYLNARVNTLKQMTQDKPLKSPSKNVHQQILSSLNISDESENTASIKKYSDYFMGIFEKRPVLMGSVLTGIAATFLFFVFNPSDDTEESIRNKQNDSSIAYDEEEDRNVEDDE